MSEDAPRLTALPAPALEPSGTVAGPGALAEAGAGAGARGPVRVEDPSVFEGLLTDASLYPGGHARGLVRARSEEDVAQFLAQTHRSGDPVLMIGAQSSLTGGAVPCGDWLLSLRGLDRIDPVIRPDGAPATIRAGAGVLLADLQRVAGEHGLYYPPVPTYDLATVGGTVATNAAGAATFKYGSTRPWIRALRMVLETGDILTIERGQAHAPAGGCFEIALGSGEVRCVPVPTYTYPQVKKVSMGYFTAPRVDLIDLLIGSEGTLGTVTQVEVTLIEKPVAVLAGWIFPPSEAAALALAGELRTQSQATWERRDPQTVDVRAIESIDAGSLDVVRREDIDRRLAIAVPADARVALYFEMEMRERCPRDALLDVLERAFAGGISGREGPVEHLVSILARHRLLERIELAFPDEPGARERFYALREAVPRAVNETAARRRLDDPAVAKLALDACVPFEALSAYLAGARGVLDARGLQHATYGHLSDGNLHLNVLARSKAEMESGREAFLEIGAMVRELGGSPMAEHGVGRSAIKQELMRRHFGDDGIRQMRALRHAFDPRERLARGVLFPAIP